MSVWAPGALDAILVRTDPDERRQAAAGRRTAGLHRASDLLLERGFWAVPAIATLALCLYQIGRPALWRDEISTWWAVSLPIGDFLHLVGRIDGVETPYYLFMRGWVAVVGDSATAMRLPSAMAMAGAAAVTALLGRRLFDATTGLIAGALFTVVPTVTRYGQEARVYAIVMLAVAVAALLLVRALDKPTWKRFGLYAASIAAIGLAHVIALAIIIGHLVGVLALWRERGQATPRWVPATAVGLLPAVPVAVIGLSQRNEQVRWLHAPSSSMAILAPRAIFWSTSVAVIILSLAVAAWRPQARTWLLVGWGLGPPAALFIVSYLTPLFLPRYVLYVIPAWCLLAALRGVSAADRRWVALLRGAVVTMLILTVSAKAQMEIRQVPQRQGFDYADAFGVIRTGYRPGDGIAYLASDWRLMLPPASSYYLPTDKRPREVFATMPARRAGWWVSTECASVAACQTDASRVWVVRSGNGPDPLADLQQPVQSVLREGYSVTEIHHGSITVALLTRR